MFFVPWWWYLWASGPRYSLRRLIGRVLLISILASIVAGVASWAFGARTAPWAAALRWAEIGAGAGVVVSLVEPFFNALRESLAGRHLATGSLRGISFGLILAYAAILGSIVYALTDRGSMHAFPALDAWLAGMRATNGFIAGSLRFGTAATIVCYPLVFLAIRGLIAFDGSALVPTVSHAPAAPRRPAFRPRERQTFIPPPGPGSTPQTTHAPPKPPPARVVRTEAGPLRPNDGEG